MMDPSLTLSLYPHLDKANRRHTALGDVFMVSVLSLFPRMTSPHCPLDSYSHQQECRRHEGRGQFYASSSHYHYNGAVGSSHHSQYHAYATGAEASAGFVHPAYQHG